MLRGDVGSTADAVFRFNHAAIKPEVVATVLGIARDPNAGSQKRRGIKAGRRNEVRKTINATVKVWRGQHYFLRRRVGGAHLFWG